MRTRKFWRRAGLTAILLIPFSVLWFAWMRVREFLAEPEKFGVPVICVGNVTAGGAGKTPVAIAVAKQLMARGKKPVFISRGYGGRLKGPVKVNPAEHTADDVGDEPLLLARIAPCYVARKRVEAAELAVAEGASVIIADDGMQNHSFAKDLTLAVVDGAYGFGNKLVLPAGPLRDRIDLALKPAQAAVVTGSADTKVMKLLQKANLPVHGAELQPDMLPDAAQAYVAFAGIGLPEKFFATLRQVGVNVVETVAFADHHPYGKKDIRELRALAEKHNAKLITTEKDAVRLPQEFRAEVTTLPVSLAFHDAPAFRRLVEQYVP